MKFDPNRIVDDYGREIYYQVGDFKTTSKILALEQADGNIDKVSFHWNERDLDLIQWDQRPALSIDQLMDQAAREIRSKYRNVILFYSGGYDSHTIYEVFRRCGLTIDKFYTWQREWYAGHSELEFQTAIEGAKWIKKNVWNNLEIVTVSWRVKDVYEWYRTLKDDWIYHNGGVLKFSKSSRDLLAELNDDYKKMVFDQNDTVILYGFEKPRLDLYDGKWYASHIDTHFFVDFHCPALHFYYIPEIYHQQCWLQAEWMESLPGFSHEMLHTIQSYKAGPEMYRQHNLALGRVPTFYEYNSVGTSKIMWQGKDPRQVPESKEFLRQTEIYNSDIGNYYNRGIDYLQERFEHLMKGGDLPGIFSKKYYLKDFQPKILP